MMTQQQRLVWLFTGWLAVLGGCQLAAEETGGPVQEEWNLGDNGSTVPLSTEEPQRGPTPYRVGFASRDISPTRAIPMGGYGTYWGLQAATRTNGAGVHDPLMSSVMAFASPGGPTIAIVSVDLVGISPATVGRVENLVRQQLGTQELVVIISATHTHHSPDTLGLWGALPFRTGRDREYMQTMEQAVAESIVAAVQAMKPASLSYASTYKVNSDSGIPGADDKDSTVHVLVARNALGIVTGTFTSWAAHPTILGEENNASSSDWVGPFRRYMSLRYPAGTHVYMNGAIGGVYNKESLIEPQPDPFLLGAKDPDVTDGYEKIAGEGYNLFQKVLDAIKDAKPLAPYAVGAKVMDARIPLDNALFKLALRSGIVEPRALSNGHVTSRLTLVHVGPLRIATVPGEFFPASATALRAILNNHPTAVSMVAGIGNDWLGYIMTPQQYSDKELDYFRSLSPHRNALDAVLAGYQQLMGRCGLDCAEPTSKPRTILAGFARKTITPAVETWEDLNGNHKWDAEEPYTDVNGNGKWDGFYLAGFGSNRPAMGVHDDIYVVAAVLDDGNKRVGVVTVDTVGWMIEEVRDIRAALPAELEIDQLVMHAQHNHNAPDTMGLWGKDTFHTGKHPEFMRAIHTQTVAALAEAVAALTPCHMSIGEILGRDQELGVVDTRIPEVLDSGVRVALFRAAEDGRVVGTIANWANHVETVWSSNRLITADFVGYFRDGLQSGRSYDGTLKRAGVGGIAMLLIGNIGGLTTTLPDVPVHDRYLGTSFVDPSFEKARAQGYALADIVQDALEQNALKPVLNPAMSYQSDVFAVRVDNWKFILAAWVAGLVRRDTRVDGLPLHPHTDTETEVGLLKVGELWLATIPGELYPEIAVGGIQRLPGGDFDVDPVEIPPLRTLMRGQVNMMVNNANDSIGYIIPRSEWDEHEPWIEDEAPYGEENATGPDTAALVHGKLVQLFQ